MVGATATVVIYMPVQKEHIPPVAWGGREGGRGGPEP